jgi:two-component system sensor kinase FixL
MADEQSPERSPSEREPGPVASWAAELAAEHAPWMPFLRTLVDGDEHVHFVVDPEGRLSLVNRASLWAFGLSPQDCKGRSVFDFVHPDDVDDARRAYEGFVQTRPAHPVDLEFRLAAQGGGVREMAWTVYPQYDDGGELFGFASTGRDVTRRRQRARALFASETMHRALLEGSLDPVITIDDRGMVQTASDSVRTVFGYEPDELVGQNLKMIMPEPFRSEHDGYLATYRRTGVSKVLGQTREFRVVHKDGSIVDVELSIGRVDIPGQTRPHMIGSFRDLSDRKRAELAETSMLRALAAIGESAAELAHEIKTPVTAINLALRAVSDKLGEDEQEVLEDLVHRMRRLELQMRQTLSFAKAIVLHPVRCEAADLFESVAASMAPLLKGTGIVLEQRLHAGAPTVLADRLRVEEVLTNLVMNAIDTLGGSASGRILLEAQAQAGGALRLRVQDDGPGILSSVRTTLFKPFVTSKTEGTGLGLPICRRLIEEHGGTIEAVEDGDLGGACFQIDLPVDGPTEGERP